MSVNINLNGLAKAALHLPELQKLDKATKQIEGIFTKQLLEQMQKGSTSFGKGAQASIYQDLFNQAIVEATSKRGTLGLAPILYRELAPRILNQIPSEPNKTNP
jgi:Rod binding domain-containing protein